MATRYRDLKPIPTPHPLIMIGSLALIGALLIWEFRTDFRQPGFEIGSPVILIATAACEWSRRRRARQLRPPPSAELRLDLNTNHR